MAESVCDHWIEENARLEEENQQLKDKIKIYEEALEFYGFDANSLGEDGTVAKRALGYTY